MPRLRPPHDTVGFDTLVQRQDHVLTRAQLRGLGLDDHHVAAEVEARRWQQFGRRVVLAHNAAPTQPQRMWIASLFLAQPSALAAWTAAQACGMTGFDAPKVHLLVDRSCAARLPAWVRLHNSRRFSQSDIVAPGGLRCTSVERALIDIAAWSTVTRRGCAALCAGVQQRVTTAARLTTELERAGKVRRHKLLAAMLGDIGAGGHTLTEIDLGPLAARAGLPPPRRQAPRRDSFGRSRYVDAEFRLPDGETLVVEVDGAVHLQPLSWWDDMERQNDLVIGGDSVLRFDSVTVRMQPERVVGALRRMVAAHPGVLPLQPLLAG